mmetsp:Transcript_29273/g.25862  ORF Transcript_29273/g.25862 Transcript_29273/m.25862 type:complete len:115 (-) Transcript_29273:247-591(-)
MMVAQKVIAGAVLSISTLTTVLILNYFNKQNNENENSKIQKIQSVSESAPKPSLKRSKTMPLITTSQWKPRKSIMRKTEIDKLSKEIHHNLNISPIHYYKSNQKVQFKQMIIED